MKAQARLEDYLGGFRRRLRTLILARGAAMLCVAALAVTLLAVLIGTRQAFPAELMNGARLLLALSLGAVAALLLVRPLQVLRRTRGVTDIERRAPDFDGRIETYDELAGGKHDAGAQPSPFLGLLAEDAWRLARGIPAALRVPNREIVVPGMLAGAALAALVWFAAFGPDNWRYGVRHVWAGWAMADTLPPSGWSSAPATARNSGRRPGHRRLCGRLRPRGSGSVRALRKQRGLGKRAHAGR